MTFARLSLPAFLLTAACSKPEPPVLTPVSAEVTSVSVAGLSIRMTLDVENQNRLPLMVRTVQAKLTVGGSHPLGDVSVPEGIILPSRATTRLDVPLTAPWVELPALALLAASPSGVSYRLDGTLTVGGEWLNVDIPFHLDGMIPRAALVGAAARGLALPGVPVP